jgi:Cd2+/Zn2+-exporting ATPase
MEESRQDAAATGFRFRVTGMDCGGCAKTIEKGLADLDGIASVRVDFTSEILEGTGTVPSDVVEQRVRSLGYGLTDPDREAPPSEREAVQSGIGGFARYVWTRRDTRIALLAGVAVLASLPIGLLSTSAALEALLTALKWIVIALVGAPIASRGVRSLLFAREITIDLLMTAATLGAVAIGAAGEATAVILLFTLGEALEGYSAACSRASLKSLIGLRPTRATVVVTHETTEGSRKSHMHHTVKDVADLVAGDVVLVKPGELIPADGRVIDGESGIDESAITGESLPVMRGVGDEVSAGTVNGHGTLQLEVSCEAEDFTISQIARLVEQAQASRSPAERFVDRFARWYTPAVVALAVVVATLPPLAFGAPFLNPADGAPGWLYRGLALLIIACPCALVISIPVTVVSALTRLAGLGILVKGGAYLSALATARTFAFDKTGTLTRGKPTVSGLRSTDCTHLEASLDDCAPCDELVAIAAAVERASGHPLAHAVVEAANERQPASAQRQASQVTAHAGRGVTGIVDGRRVTVGHADMFESNTDLDALLARQTAGPSSLMVVGEDDRVRGYIEVADLLRDDARSALAMLRRIDDDYRFVMLTGDNAAVASQIAAELGEIDEIRAALLPEEKLAAVRELEASRGDVAMIGDGINDTPALAEARLGIAMGAAGTHQAMEVADVVLMRDDLTQLATAVELSRRTRRLVRENIALSLGLKLVFLALAIPGLATLWMAVLADVGTTLLVTLNGMRMLRAKESGSTG